MLAKIQVVASEEFTRDYEKQRPVVHRTRVTVVTGDGSQALPADGPFDVIVVSGSVAELPESLLAQLKVGGRMVAIVGEEPVMRALLITLLTGTHDQGQGHWTSFAQVVVEKLGVPFESIKLMQTDSDRLSLGGEGVGRAEGLVLFVPYAAPGDLLEIEVTDVQARFARGRLLRVLKPSPVRVAAPCVYHFQAPIEGQAHTPASKL